MVLKTACPIKSGEKIYGVVYGGILLNGNTNIVENISSTIFRGETYDKREVGFVTIYQGDRAISSSLKDDAGQFKSNFKADHQIVEKVLKDGDSNVTWKPR